MINVPDYRLGEEIGVGGTGVVYRATRISDGAMVAVKVIKVQRGASEYQRRLRTEAELVARVRHDGVIDVHEVGGDDEWAWLAMDLVPGPDLQRLVDEQGPLSTTRAAELLAAVADAVSAVHAAGLVHRDLKPANILLDGDRPRITDFGVARLATHESSLADGLTGGTNWLHSASGHDPGLLPASGTVAYMAPEQWRGDEGDARSDVYALGGTLYTALTGRRPFPQRSLPELAYAVAVTPPPAPSDQGTPAAFDSVVATAMAKDPEQRYPDAAAFATAVRAAAEGKPLPDVTAARAHQLPRRRWPAVVTAVVMMLVGGMLVMWRPWAGPSTDDRVVCARDLTIRDQPRSRTVIGTLYRGNRIQVYEDSPLPAWGRTDLPDGRQGWVLTQFLGPPCRR